MDIWVRAGPNFHAGHELESWIRPADGYEHAAAVYTCVGELADVRNNGFATRIDYWRREGFDEVWTFVTLSFCLAATFPGDGRGDTRDFCLVASGKIGKGRQTAAGKQALLATVGLRLTLGNQVLFPL